MSIPKFTVDVNAHQNLADQPALSSTQLKQAWDKPANDIKNYINNTLVDAIDEAIETITASIDTAITTKLQAIYPVGRVIYSESSINPATIFGFGTWELTGQGQFIVGYDSTNTKFNEGGKTGGSLTKTIASNQIPTLSFTGLTSVSAKTTGDFDYSATPQTFTRSAIRELKNNSGTVNITNNDQQALDITPTYKTMYMYKRVS
jgi:hypothetical protein